LRRLAPCIVAEMWRVTVLVHRAIRAALFPIALPDLPRVLSAFLEHIARRNEKKRLKQIMLFLQETEQVPG
jgi:hypothetical protein